MSQIEIDFSYDHNGVATVRFDCGCVACDETYYPYIKWCDFHRMLIRQKKEELRKDEYV